MDHPALLQMAHLANQSDAQEATIQYLTEKLSFLKQKETVLILFSAEHPQRIGSLLAEAVRRRGAEPVFWEDRRWMALLRLAFSTRASTVIGAPITILGLSKVARFRGIPLSIRNVVTTGYPCLDWMIDGIIKGLDCRTWGCFEPGDIVAGFSCGKSRGVHLRDAEYGVDIVDDDGNVLPEGEAGRIVLYPRSNPEIRYLHTDRGRLEFAPCACGCASPRLMDITIGVSTYDKDLLEFAQFLHNWTSILDCRMQRGEYGLELEIVVFPGEKLPKLPTAARLIVRAWDPEKDEPFFYVPIPR